MFAKEVYQNRRYKLQGKVGSGIILLLGNTEAPMNYADNTYHFRQDSTFLYFFGHDIPDLAAVIDVDNNCEYLVGDDISIDHIIWMGPQEPMREKADRVGVREVMPSGKLAAFLKDAISKGRTIHFLPPYRAENVLKISDLLDIKPAEIKDRASLKLIHACIALRSIKEDIEIQEIERHMAVGYDMHTTAMKMAHPGVKESHIAGAIEGISLAGGGMVSFPVICSVRGETLHNHNHGNILKANDLLLVDAGSESPLHYATDHTRTIPVGGKFTTMQREIYQIVLDANNAVSEAIAPGMPYRDIHFVAARTIVEGLKSIGLMKGDVEQALAEGAHALFFPHGIGHMLGLDVHDMEDYNDTLVGYDDEIKRSTQFGLRSLRLGRRLQPGFVITNEPGIYFIPALIDLWKSQDRLTDFINYDKLKPYYTFGGIRLEDDVLVTRTGGRLLGNRIPITIDDVEAMVQSGNI
jgi:Xaa-Pro aminopeptidase